MSCTKAIAVLFVLLVLVSSLFVLSGLASDEKELAVLAISGAEDSVGLAYEAVLEAEAAGANVSSLLVRLNVAGEFLARAHAAFGKGDFAGPIEEADRSRQIADEVEADAVVLKDWAHRERLQHRLSSIMHSMIAIGVIGVGTAVSWHVFKRRIQRRIPETKPEVN